MSGTENESSAGGGGSVVALVADLIFGSKITATAALLGVPVSVVRSAESLLAAAPSAAGVLIDLNVPGLDGPEAVRRVKALRPELRVLGFLSHVQLELAEHAKAAGADEVMPRSRFSAHLPEILKRYAAGGA